MVTWFVAPSSAACNILLLGTEMLAFHDTAIKQAVLGVLAFSVLNQISGRLGRMAAPLLIHIRDYPGPARRDSGRVHSPGPYPDIFAGGFCWSSPGLS
jgi:hypothetical protein